MVIFRSSAMSKKYKVSQQNYADLLNGGCVPRTNHRFAVGKEYDVYAENMPAVRARCTSSWEDCVRRYSLILVGETGE